MAIRNLDWKLETQFTRKQVIAMAKVAEFIGNIEKQISEGFPSVSNEIDWQSVREVMTLFSRLGSQDTLAHRALVQAVYDVNQGNVQLLCGRVVPVEQNKSDQT